MDSHDSAGCTLQHRIHTTAPDSLQHLIHTAAPDPHYRTGFTQQRRIRYSTGFKLSGMMDSCVGFIRHCLPRVVYEQREKSHSEGCSPRQHASTDPHCSAFQHVRQRRLAAQGRTPEKQNGSENRNQIPPLSSRSRCFVSARERRIHTVTERSRRGHRGPSPTRNAGI